MKFKQLTFLIVLLGLCSYSYAQHLFSAELEQGSNYSTAYLSLVEDYRKVGGLHEDQIINSVSIIDDSFTFSGTNLDSKNRIYRIHIDNCTSGATNGHFNGQCETSRSILFVANKSDTIHFPVAFENQLLCNIESERTHTKVLSQVDSLKELMTYDYLSYRSETNKKINNKNWFTKLQQFGASLDEPLAELYIYQFLSDRSGDFYDYYLEDLSANSYYDELLGRLKRRYDGETFTKQYELELAADKYRIQIGTSDAFNWQPWILIVLFFVALGGVIGWIRMKRPKRKLPVDLLTQQEQKVLDLILENKSNKEIAQEIFVSVSTVKTHINNLYKKLNVTSREQVKLLFDR